jgi:hypothetical protein
LAKIIHVGKKFNVFKENNSTKLELIFRTMLPMENYFSRKNCMYEKNDEKSRQKSSKNRRKIDEKSTKNRRKIEEKLMKKRRKIDEKSTQNRRIISIN